jgi:hypothetical protein
MSIVTKEAKRAMESRVFRRVFTRFGFLRWDTWFRGTLAFPDCERSEQRRTNRLLQVEPGTGKKQKGRNTSVLQAWFLKALL